MKKLRNEDRTKVLADYYRVPKSLIYMLLQFPHESRKKLCWQCNIDPHIFRAMLDYTRYPQANFIHQSLLRFGDLVSSMSILDFGCLVSDYGIFFSRLGARVSIYDTAGVTNFALHRFIHEGLPVQRLIIPKDYGKIIASKDLVIFGEVLEHMERPLDVLRECVTNQVRYIFTSHYPFGGNHYYSRSGHLKSAQEQQPASLELLKTNYHGWHMSRNAYLWQKRASYN